MRSKISDTNKQVDEEYAKLLRNCPVSEKLSHVFEMSSWTLNLAKRAIARSNPSWSTEEVNLYFVKIFYGDSLQQKVASRMNRKL
ncbi:MAG: hypothetical protein A3F16_00130 [Deltaproteobacteria bacterium RIFCSPHIGHO2_12_FULL_43_9]|nr:MAG: hypothetical protein A3F16_00130 [Deltaproteobacteria bacterium RIFCSPHIGHO2_12_FULL_43_9]